jgi:RNA polymerase sigma-70 factor, ECF subfamily
MRIWVDEAGHDVADGVTEKAAMLAALAQLGDDDRELLTLVAWHGLRPAEAARVVGCSTAAYAVRLHRARKRLQQLLAPPALPAALPADRRIPITVTSKEFSR